METGSFVNKEGWKIFTRHWAIEGDAKAVVIIVHGLGEHSGRYLHVADALNEAGYICYALDHHGNGNSEGPRFQVKSDTQFIDDLKQFYDSIKSQHPDKKIFMLAHSLGSIIGLHFIYTHPKAIDCAAITGTATARGIDLPAVLINLLKVIPYQFPYQFPPLPPLAPFKPEDADVLSRNPDFHNWFTDDLTNKGWTAISTAKYGILTGLMLQENAAKISVPIMFSHGEADVVVPVEGSTIMYEGISSTDKRLKLWSEMAHEIMNEIDYEEVLAEIIAWYDEH